MRKEITPRKKSLPKINIYSPNSYNNLVKKLFVSEAGGDCSHIAYLYHSLLASFQKETFSSKLTLLRERLRLEICFPESLEERVRKTLALSAAEIFGIGYKYDFLKKNLRRGRLTRGERELLLTALVAADFPDEKGYLLKRVSFEKELCLDGIYRFRLQELKEKWAEILSLLPNDYLEEEFERFICFLLEGDESKIYVKGDEVYNENYLKQRRSGLISSYPELSFFREVMLSGAGKVCFLTPPKKEACAFLKKYYAGRFFYAKRS